MPELLEHAELHHLALAHSQPERIFPETCPVLGVPISATSMERTVALLNHWIATTTRPRLVTFTNVHMVVEAQLSPEFQEVLSSTDLNCPDGAPVFWLARMQDSSAHKISGPDFMPMFCGQSVEFGHKHFLYGGAEGVPEQAAANLRERFPGIQIVGEYAPPFRDLTEAEADAVIDRINASGADVVWVSLGCPRQEWWIHHQGRKLNAKVVLAVGQATDILAGARDRCPSAMSRVGLEWAYRLAKDPRRLWKRYLVTNSLFLLLLLRSKMLRAGSN
jgi:N-acetylglucosaminyldiphosphoundecaprenol N-acetyl-beta-D-mannosaminyltransferase